MLYVLLNALLNRFVCWHLWAGIMHTECSSWSGFTEEQSGSLLSIQSLFPVQCHNFSVTGISQWKVYLATVIVTKCSLLSHAYYIYPAFILLICLLCCCYPNVHCVLIFFSYNKSYFFKFLYPNAVFYHMHCHITYISCFHFYWCLLCCCYSNTQCVQIYFLIAKTFLFLFINLYLMLINT